MDEEKNELIEVNILVDENVMEEKDTGNTKQELMSIKSSVCDGQPKNNDQLFSNDQQNRNRNSRSFFKQNKSLPGSHKKGILYLQETCVNSTKNLLEDTSFFQCRCNMAMVENILLVIAIITVVAIFLIPVVLYYTRPSIPDTDDSMVNFFKTCQFPVSYN